MNNHKKTVILILLIILLTLSNSYSYEKLENGISIQPRNSPETGVKTVVVKILSDDIIQVIGLPADRQTEPSSLIIDDKIHKPASFKIEEQTSEIYLLTNKLRIIINKGYGEITIKNTNDEIVFQEGTRQIVPGEVLDEKVNHIQQSFQWADDEALYGLGQHQEGIFNWRGHYVELVQYNMRAVVPFLLSSKGYGILWDNTSYTRFNDTRYGS